MGQYLDSPLSLLVSDLLWQYGIEDVVVSPGTRNSPLIVAFARNGRYRLHSVIDERTAAFYALGLACGSGARVAMVCTSGSAVLNYMPALSEALYRGVGLVAISADRPSRMVDTFAGQTIRQAGALAAVTGFCADLGVGMNLHQANRLVNEALSRQNVPVHINVQLDMPLTKMTDVPPLPYGLKIDYAPAEPDTRLVNRLASMVKAGRRVMILAGQTAPVHGTVPALESLSPNVVVVADAFANYPWPEALRSGAVDQGIKHYREAVADELLPEVVITIGGEYVCARLKAFLRKIPHLEHYAFHTTEAVPDYLDALCGAVRFPDTGYMLASLHTILSARSSLKSEFAPAWTTLAAYGLHEIEQMMVENTHPVTIMQGLANSAGLSRAMISNGSVARYAQMVKWPRGVEVFANRGVAGIEGCTSTAIGIATSEPKHNTLLVTGDVSAAYDIQALSLVTPPTFTMVVLDNNGGDIFRNIVTTRNLPELEEYITTPPVYDFNEMDIIQGRIICLPVDYVNHHDIF